MLSKLNQYLDVSTCMHFSNLKLSKLSINLSHEMIPKRLDYSLYYDASKVFENTQYSELLNVHKLPISYIKEKKNDLYYAKEIINKSDYLQANKLVSSIMKSNKVGIYDIKIDPTYSFFNNCAIYNGNFASSIINAINSHPCLVYRLDNGVLKIYNLTHHPLNINDFIYLCNKDLNNSSIGYGQWLSKIGFECPEQMVKMMRVSKTYNTDLVDQLLNSNYSLNAVSEEFLFHVYNNGNRLSMYENLVDQEIDAHTSSELMPLLLDVIDLFKP